MFSFFFVPLGTKVFAFEVGCLNILAHGCYPIGATGPQIADLIPNIPMPVFLNFLLELFPLSVQKRRFVLSFLSNQWYLGWSVCRLAWVDARGTGGVAWFVAPSVDLSMD